MNVRSEKGLTEDLIRQLQAGATEPKREAAAPIPTRAKRIAVFAIHGISPIQRYAFQDQVASAIQSYLNAQEQLAGSLLSWRPVVHWPTVGQSGADVLRPSALRICRSDDDAENPRNATYDVYEGYWSPLSKGKTNIASAVRWLLNSTFLATSSTANLPCTRKKLLSDLVYITALLAGAVLALALAIACALWAWFMLTQMLPTPPRVSMWEALGNPLSAALKLPMIVYLELAIDLLASYILAQIVVAARVGLTRHARTRELHSDAKATGRFAAQTVSARAFHVWSLRVLGVLFIVLVALAIAIAYKDGHFADVSGAAFAGYAAVLTLGVGFLQISRSAADFALENILGDIEIYTTHDNNSTFYSIRHFRPQPGVDSRDGHVDLAPPNGARRFADCRTMEAHPFTHDVRHGSRKDALLLRCAAADDQRGARSVAKRRVRAVLHTGSVDAPARGQRLRDLLVEPLVLSRYRRQRDRFVRSRRASRQRLLRVVAIPAASAHLCEFRAPAQARALRMGAQRLLIGSALLAGRRSGDYCERRDQLVAFVMVMRPVVMYRTMTTTSNHNTPGTGRARANWKRDPQAYGCVQQGKRTGCAAAPTCRR